jgi:hypothetical protein
MKTVILAIFFGPAIFAAKLLLSPEKFNDLLTKIGQAIP